MHPRFLVLPLLVIVAGPALAQTPRPERPYRGLFGGHDSVNQDTTTRLDLSFTLYGGYDDNILANNQGGNLGEQTVRDPRFQASGSLGGAQTGLDYSRRTKRSSIEFSVGSAYRYYPSVDRFSGVNAWADAGFSVAFTERTSLRVSESAYYSPYYSLAPFDLITETGPQVEEFFLNQEYALIEDPAIMYGSSADFSHRLTQRASVSVDYALRYVDFQDAQKPLQDTMAGGRFTYSLTRNAKAKLGYHYRRAEYGVLAELRHLTEIHHVDAGVDYSRSLSISRKTTFGFTTGSAMYKGVRGADGSAADERMHYAVTGSAFLKREIGRSWIGQVDYSRAMRVIEGFGTPFFTDSVTGRMNGFAGRRTRLSATAGYTTAEVGSGSGNRYSTFMANVHAQVAVARYLGFYTDYVFYHYAFDAGVALPDGMSRGVDRNGVRVGLNFWVPLLR